MEQLIVFVFVDNAMGCTFQNVVWQYVRNYMGRYGILYQISFVQIKILMQCIVHEIGKYFKVTVKKTWWLFMSYCCICIFQKFSFNLILTIFFQFL